MNRALLLLSRALRRRCPACGRGRLFASWFQIRERCPSCGLVLEREEGYYTGALALNMIVAEGLFVIGLVATLILTWPTPPWDLLQYGSIVGVVAAPLLFYPFSKTIWLALDLLFRPVEQREIAPGEFNTEARGRVELVATSRRPVPAHKNGHAPVEIKSAPDK